MNLQEALQTWDGSEVAQLALLAEPYGQGTALITELLITLQHNPELDTAVVWLLKYQLEQGEKFSYDQQELFCSLLTALESWQSRLQALQILDKTELTAVQEIELLPWVKKQVDDSNTFVRAWAYNALYLCSQHDSALLKDSISTLEKALQNERPSVQSKLRKILSRHSN